MSIYSIRSAVLLISLVAALARTPVAPEAGNIIFPLAAGIGLLLLRDVDLPVLRFPVVWMPLLGVALLVFAFGLRLWSGHGGRRGHVSRPAGFSPFLAIGRWCPWRGQYRGSIRLAWRC
jgi:hypothetical protein